MYGTEVGFLPFYFLIAAEAYIIALRLLPPRAARSGGARRSGDCLPWRLTQAMDIEEEGRLRWYMGQSVLRQHTFDSRILDVTPCNFDGTSCLAVLESDRVSIYHQDGAVHSVALACKPRVLWPLRRGIVIEGGTSASTSAATFLLLERALDEPQAIDHAGAGRPVGTILLSDSAHSRLLAHDEAGRRHVLWAIAREAPPADATPAGTPSPPALVPVWEQAEGAAATAASCYFVSPSRGLAPALLFLLQTADGHLYCFPLPWPSPPASARSAAAAAAAAPGAASGVSAVSPGPIASIPALSAQPVVTGLAPLVVASLLVLAPTGHLELYSCGDDGAPFARARRPSPALPFGEPNHAPAVAALPAAAAHAPERTDEAGR